MSVGELVEPRGSALAAFLPGLIALESAGFSPPWTAAALQEEADHPDGALLLLCASAPETEDAPQVLAYCCTRTLYDEVHLLRIATDPALRRRGLGARLLKEVLDRARARGHAVLLEVRGDNQAALGLYLAHGFAVIGRRRGYYSDGAEALVLRIELPAT